MASASSIAARLSAKAASLFTRHGDTWVAHVQYANGHAYTWGIKLVGEEFDVEVHNGGTFRVNRKFYELAKAQKAAARYIERADGEHLLKAAVDAGRLRPVRG